MKHLYQIQNFKNDNTEITTPAQMKFIQDEKGNAIFLNSLNSINSIAVLEFVPGMGVRGNHYHKFKREIMYILDGIAKLYLWLPDQPEIEEIFVEGGHLITIEARLGHAIKAVKRTFGLEISPNLYDPNDIVCDERIK